MIKIKTFYFYLIFVYPKKNSDHFNICKAKSEFTMQNMLPFTSHSMSSNHSSVTESHNCKNLDAQVFRCSFCDLTFQTNKLLQRHKFVHKTKTTFSCSECQYKCHRKQYLNHHLLTHSKEKNFLCSVCGETFTFHETLKNHVMSKHPTEKPFLCNFCSFQTSGALTLKQHMVKHINHFISCSLCPYSCSSEAGLKKHQETHTVETSKLCDTCSLTFPTTEALQAHKLSHATHNQQNYKCHLCPFASLTQMVYVRHMSTHNVSKPFICDICDYGSDRRVNLKMHMKRQHKLTLPSVVSFKCVHCSFACERSQDFTKHMLTEHNIEKPFTCLSCPFSTHRQSLLNVHLETHKPHAFTCQFCNFQSKRKTLLNKHLMTKHAEDNCPDESDPPALSKRLYICKFCNFKSRHYASLRNHLPMHSNIRFSCSQCSYVTYSRRNLASHSKSHVKEKPYKCQFCHYTSARIGNFKMHMVTHVNEKKYYCSKCSYVCLYQRDLAGHVSSVHNTSDKSEESSTLWHQKSAEEVRVHTEDDQNNAEEVHMSTDDGSNDNVQQVTIIPCVTVTENSIHLSSSATFQSMVNKDLAAIENSEQFRMRIQNPESIGPRGDWLISVKNTEEGPSLNDMNVVITNTEGPSLNDMNVVITNTEGPSLNEDNKLNCEHLNNGTAGELSSGVTLNENKFLDVVTYDERCSMLTKPAHQGDDTSGSTKTLINCKRDSSKIEKTFNFTNTLIVNGEASCDPPNATSCGPPNAASCGPLNAASCVPLNATSCGPLNAASCGPPNATSCGPPNAASCDPLNAASCGPLNAASCGQSTAASCGPPNAASCGPPNSASYGPPNAASCGPTNAASCSPPNAASCGEVQQIICKFCNTSWNSDRELKLHTQVHARDTGTNEPVNSRMSSQQKTVPSPQDKIKLYSCWECDFHTQSPSEFSRHMGSSHNIQKPFCCKLCPYTSKRVDDLKTHTITHDDGTIRSCGMCDYTCKRVPALRKHLRKHTDVILFSCSLCGFGCNFEPDLRSHMLHAHDKNKCLTCRVCQSSFQFAAHYKHHMLSQHDIENAFLCPHCEYSTNVWNNFRAHRLKHTSKQIRIRKQFDTGHLIRPEPKTHLGTFGNNKSLDGSELDRPKKRQNQNCKTEHYFLCHVCQRKYKHASSLCKHISLVHKATAKKQLCSMCSYKTSTVALLKRHLLTHGIGKRFQCTVCQFGCNHREVLNNHLLLHNSIINCHDAKLLEPVSSKSKDMKPSESKDIQQQTQTECSRFMLSLKPSVSKIDFSRHTCTLCDHRFRNASSLNKHLLRHKKFQNLNQFRCSVCSFKCLRPHELKLHTFTHTGETPYSCSECDFQCSKPYTLKYHKQKHHSELTTGCESFTCSLCQFECRSNLHLQQHLQVKHSDDLQTVKHSDNLQPVKHSDDLQPFKYSNHLQPVKHSDDLQPVNHSDNLLPVKLSDDLQPVEHSYNLQPVNSSLSGTNVSTSTTSKALHLDSSANANNRHFNQRSHSSNSRQFFKRISPHECGGINAPSIDSFKLSYNECDDSTTDRRNPTSHVQKHGLKSFLCHLCNYTCRRGRELKRHLVTHEHSKPLSCDLCSYSCIHRSSLRVHMLKHKGEKPVCCKLCDFRCRQASTLCDHMTRHSDERKFICHQCGHQAKRAIALKIHLLAHSTEKPVACPLCDFTCKNKNSLRSHLISHGPEND